MIALNKWEFWKLLDRIKPSGEWYYKYWEGGNDPCNLDGSSKKMASFSFYGINSITNEEVVLCEGNIRTFHAENRDKLIKKYTYWAKQWAKRNQQ